MTTRGYLGIDAGTQGLSVIFTDEKLNVLEVGEGSYEMLPGLAAECYEQDPMDWIQALKDAMQELRKKFEGDMEVLAIGISGQMHGEVLADEDGRCLSPARLWCDARNEQEGHELTEAFGVKMPKRATASRWLWTVRNQKDKAVRVRHMTTPAGWISYQLTGKWKLGIGDASGMFPMDSETLNYHGDLLEKFTQHLNDDSVAPLAEILPEVVKAGEDAGNLSQQGSTLLGLPEGTPVSPAEGDQPAALAGSLIANAGMVSVSFGTSVCANSVGDRPFNGVSQAVDHFCAVDGKPINMVWLRNGTTYMNSVVEMFGHVLGSDRSAGFAAVIPRVLDASPDCDGVVALPFMDDEPGLEVSRGGTAMLAGLTSENSTPGNVVKAALLSTMFNLKLGSEVLDRQGYPRTELVLSGGLTKTPELSQILADVFETPVTLLESAEEGTAWGAALLAKYRHLRLTGENQTWSHFIDQLDGEKNQKFEADEHRSGIYRTVYDRYKRLAALNSQLVDAIG
ncbi:MAG: hypothetical protein MK136_05625 [Pirellulaceae bacterium]|nr:hypothetical protein [Pirellulaceae bacterium]